MQDICGRIDLEDTFVMIKPDGVRRGLIGDVVSRFERRGLTIESMRLETLTRVKAEEHYIEHRGKPFYEPLVEYVTSGPVVLMIISGNDAVAVCRATIGATNPGEAAPGSIRGDLALEISENVVHGSDSLASAEREIRLYFQ